MLPSKQNLVVALSKVKAYNLFQFSWRMARQSFQFIGFDDDVFLLIQILDARFLCARDHAESISVKFVLDCTRFQIGSK